MTVDKCKGEIPVHAMKAYGSGGIAQHIHNLIIR